MVGEHMETKAYILKKAKEEFIRRGYDKASLRRIAASCDLTTGAIYGLFRNKEELFHELVKEGMNELSFLGSEVEKILQSCSFTRENGEFPTEEIDRVARQLMKHQDTVALLAFSSQGSRYEEETTKWRQWAREKSVRWLEEQQNRPLTKMQRCCVEYMGEMVLRGILSLLQKRKSQREIAEILTLYSHFFAAGINELSLVLIKEREEKRA